MNKEIQEALGKVLSNVTDESLTQRLVEAKKVYFELTGMVNDEDSDYESRMDNFNEWFLFNYIPKDRTTTYIVEYLKNADVTEEIRNSLLEIRYSVFEFVKKSFTGKIVLKDILYDRKIKISSEFFSVGIMANDIFVGRIGDFRGIPYLLKGIRYLPKEVKSIIKKRAKVVRKMGNPSEELKFVLTVERYKTKWDHYGHIEPTKIFAFH